MSGNKSASYRNGTTLICMEANARQVSRPIVYLTLKNQIYCCPSDLFYRHIEIDLMLIEEIGGIDPQPLQRRLCNLLDVIMAAVQCGPAGNREFSRSFGQPPMRDVGARRVSNLGLLSLDDAMRGKTDTNNAIF